MQKGTIWAIFGLLYTRFVDKPGQKISCTKTQTFPNFFHFASLAQGALEEGRPHPGRGRLPHQPPRLQGGGGPTGFNWDFDMATC